MGFGRVTQRFTWLDHTHHPPRCLHLRFFRIVMPCKATNVQRMLGNVVLSIWRLHRYGWRIPGLHRSLAWENWNERVTVVVVYLLVVVYLWIIHDNSIFTVAFLFGKNFLFWTPLNPFRQNSEIRCGFQSPLPSNKVTPHSGISFATKNRGLIWSLASHLSTQKNPFPVR